MTMIQTMAQGSFATTAAVAALRLHLRPRRVPPMSFPRLGIGRLEASSSASLIAPPSSAASASSSALRSASGGSLSHSSSSSSTPKPVVVAHRVRVPLCDVHCRTTTPRSHPAGFGGGPSPIQHRLLSSSSSSSSSVVERVEVTKTRSVTQHDDDEADDDDEDGDEQQAADGGGCCGGSSGGEVKSPERMAEERLMDIQHHIRQTHAEGRYSDSLKASEALIEGCEVLYGKTHPATASAYNNAAVMHKLLGEYGEAAERYHDALRVYGEVVGKDHASYAAALNNLGNLLRTQAQLDPEMSSFQRLQLNESAIEYLEEALRIRSVELGDDHPHTVTSRSNLGGALASHVLSSSSPRSDGCGGEGGDEKIPPSKLTRERWEAAEDHLRSALRISIKNQDRIHQPDQDDGGDGAGTTTGAAVVRTLPPAAAAQNLAVFLKCRADRLGGGDGDCDSAGGGDVDREDMYAEARKLYDEALSVRVVWLGDAHPDTVATRHSLAELLLATGDEVGSDRLRREILDSLGEEGYDVEGGGRDSAAK